MQEEEMTSHPSEKLYVLVTDPRMPSNDNLWATEPARSPEEASARFRARINNWHSYSKYAHELRMEVDRERRLREEDFAVELC